LVENFAENTTEKKRKKQYMPSPRQTLFENLAGNTFE
jgi:hypothetical protein